MKTDGVDHDTLRGDGRVQDPIAPEPSGPRGQGVLDRIVLGGVYFFQWLRSRRSSRHEGRS